MSSQPQDLYNLCLKLDPKEFKNRLVALCDFFLGCKYGPWQDGANLESMDDFKYQLDLLDCVTYPEVVLALAKTKPLPTIKGFFSKFENILSHIHYSNGITNFKSRNHFMCLDWIPNNKHIIEDVTSMLSDDTKISEAVIDKASWMQHTRNYRLSNTPAVQVTMPYIETKTLLDDYNNFVNKFPEYCIVNIVRPNWDLTATMGTHLNISHLGLAFKNSHTNDMDFYHATSEKMLVVKDTLQNYMQRCKGSPTIRGISVLAISPGYINAR